MLTKVTSPRIHRIMQRSWDLNLGLLMPKSELLSQAPEGKAAWEAR